MFTRMMGSYPSATISVLEKQYQQYFEDTWTVTDKLKPDTHTSLHATRSAIEVNRMYMCSSDAKPGQARRVQAIQCGRVPR